MGRARGRMLAWRISQSRKVNALPGWGQMLLYTWLIPHFDNLGRQHGEPVQVKAAVFPRRDDITLELLAVWLRELDEHGLVIWYEVDGMRFLAMPERDWKREQKLHKNMSRDSDLPAPTEGVRKAYGNPPDTLRYEVEGKGRGSEVEVEGEGEIEVEREGEGESREEGAIRPAATVADTTVRKRTGPVLEAAANEIERMREAKLIPRPVSDEEWFARRTKR